jgi:hypothetical protein
MAEEAKLTISMDDKASPAAKRVADAIGSVGDAARQAGQAQANMGPGLDAMRSRFDSLVSSIQGFAPLLAAGGIIGMGVMTITRLAGSLADAAKEGEALNKTSVALDRALFQAGQSASEFRKAMQEATGGEVALATLEKQAVSLRRMGFEFEQIIQLQGAAKSAADITNEDVTQATESLGKALLTGAQKALIPYGILIDKTQVLATAAREAGIPVAALTEEQERQAVVSAGLAQLTGQTQDAVNGLGSAAERTEAKLRDMVDGIKKSWGGGIPTLFSAETAGLFEGAKSIEDQVRASERAIRELQRVQADAQKELEYQAARGFFGSGSALDQASETLTRVSSIQGEVIRALRANLVDLGADAVATAEKMRGLNLATMAGTDGVERWIETLVNQEDALQKGAAVVAQFAEGLGTLGRPLAEVAAAAEEQAAALGEQRARLEELDDAYYAGRDAIAAWNVELRKLRAEGQGAGEEAKSLESWIKVATDARKSVEDVGKALAGLQAPKGTMATLREQLPWANADQIAVVANALDRLTESEKALEEARKTGTLGQQRALLEQVAEAALTYEGRLKDAGLTGAELEEVHYRITESVATMALEIERAGQRATPVYDELARRAQTVVATVTGLWRQLAALKPPPAPKPTGGRTAAKEALDEYELAEVAAQRAAQADKEYMDVLARDRADMLAAESQAFTARKAQLANWAEHNTTTTGGAFDQNKDRLARWAAEYVTVLEDMRLDWQLLQDTISQGWSQAMGAVTAAGQIAGSQMSAFWSTTMQSIGDLTTNAISAIGSALEKDWSKFGNAMSAGLSALTPILAALTGSARVAAGVIGGIALAAAAVFAMTGLGWAVAGPLGALGLSLLAYAAVPQKKASRAATASAPSVSASASASSGTRGQGNITIVQYYSGAPIVTGEEIADFTAKGLRGMVAVGMRAPREVIPA